MVITLPHRLRDVDPLAPVTMTLRAMFGSDALPALAPGLLVTDETGWRPATDLTSGDRIDDLLDAAKQEWRATPHAAAALAWKSYTYWLAMPAVFGWASARRVPLLTPDAVLIRFDGPGRLLMFGFRRSVPVAVLPTDPLALAGSRAVRVVADEAALLAAFRESLLDAHLTPLLGAIQSRVRVGARTLLGSVSSGIAHAILRAADVLPGSTAEHIGTLLDALGVDDLIDLVPDAAGQLTVQRKTCCLAFTLPRPKVCTGCCIRP